MIFYFNGCSFTYGDELDDRESHAWPALVSESVGAEFRNDAISGGSNDRIVFKTLSDSTDYDCYFIAWTTYTRFTEYNPVDNFEINFTPELKLDPTRHQSTDLKDHYEKYKKYGEMYYKYWFNELYAFKKWLQQIILLQSFFSVRKKRYLMLNTMSNNLHVWLQPPEIFAPLSRYLIEFFNYLDDEQLLRERQQIQILNSQVDKSSFIGWDEWNIMSLGEPHPHGPGGHILEAGHQAVAKKVLEYYNKL